MNEIVQMLQIHLPQSSISENFLKLNNEKKSLCLKIGMECLDKCDHSIENFYNQEVSEIREEEEQKLKKIEDQLKTMQKSHKQELENVAKSVYEKSKIENEESNKQLKERLEKVEDEYYTFKRSIESQRIIEIENFNTKLINEMSKRDENMHIREENLRRSYEEKLENERNKNSKLEALENNSSLKGKQGEEDMEKLLNRIFPKAEIFNCAAESQRGDFNLLQDSMNMMIDVKNYRKNVQKTEVDKFHRDMIANPEYTCGVLISLHSGVCNKSDMSLEIVNERPIIYLHNFLDDTKKIIYCINVVKMIHSIENLNLKDQEIVEAIVKMQKEFKKKYTSTKKELDKFYNKMSTSLDEQDNMIKILFGLFQSKNQ